MKANNQEEYMTSKEDDNIMEDTTYKYLYPYYTQRATPLEIGIMLNEVTKIHQTENIEITSENANTELERISSPDTLFVISGPSCSGKSTLGEKLAKKINGYLIDIDVICFEHFKKICENNAILSSESYILEMYTALTSAYLQENLDNLVSDAKKQHKPVILVGGFINNIARCLISYIFGRSFTKIVGICCFEPNLDLFKKAVEDRRKRIGEDDFLSRIEKVYGNPIAEYNQIKNTLYNYKDTAGNGFDYFMFMDFESIYSIG